MRRNSHNRLTYGVGLLLIFSWFERVAGRNASTIVLSGSTLWLRIQQGLWDALCSILILGVIGRAEYVRLIDWGVPKIPCVFFVSILSCFRLGMFPLIMTGNMNQWNWWIFSLSFIPALLVPSLPPNEEPSDGEKP